LDHGIQSGREMGSYLSCWPVENQVKILKFRSTEQTIVVGDAILANLKKRLEVDQERLKEVNDFLLSEDNPLIDNLLEVIQKYGDVSEINRKAQESGRLENLMKRLEKKTSPFLKDLEWLTKQRDKQAFITIPNYRRKVLGKKADSMNFDESSPVTLEISAFNFFPWLIEEASRSIAKKELMPGRYIRVRSMKEQVEDDDVIAYAAAMQIIGASYVQTLDTKGTMPGADGKPINVHLGGPETITGYFGGVGEPNDHALKWVDEYLHYYTEYGLRQVLNTNPGTVLLGYLMRKLGIDIEFKISVFLGYDNPYSILWTLMTAKLLSRDDDSTPLIGFNLSNSVNNETIELTAFARKALGFEDAVRIEHHITEAYKSIVRQPYNRTKELVELADHVKNVSAKHEGGLPEDEKTREHPSDILDYFMAKKDIIEKGLMPKLLANYLDKHEALNKTAEALTKHGLTFIAAQKLHSH
jgi:DNA-binding phage protein